MGILERIFHTKTNPNDIFKMSNNPHDFINELANRKYWRDIDKKILSDIASNTLGKMELLRNFAFVSEQYQLVKNNYLSFSNNTETLFGSPLSSFAMTLYSLGSDLCKHSTYVGVPAQQQQFMLMTADMAFTSAVLCDPLQLAPYAGMAFLYSEILFNRKVALEWCGKYKNAEDKLLNTPNEGLSPFQQSAKRLIENPDLEMITYKEISNHVPNLMNGNPLNENKQMKNMIANLERKLRKKIFVRDDKELFERSLWLANKIYISASTNYGQTTLSTYINDDRFREQDQKIFFEILGYIMSIVLEQLGDEIEENYGGNEETNEICDLNIRYRVFLGKAFDAIFDINQGDPGFFYDLFQQYHQYEDDYDKYWGISHDITDDDLMDDFLNIGINKEVYNPLRLYTYRISKIVNVVDRDKVMDLTEKRYRDIGMVYYDQAFFDLPIQKILIELKEMKIRL